jgi:segregation and condensation protein B
VALSRGTLDVLLEAGWIQPKGRRQTPGRPLTWGTSPAFLDHFGLVELGDLPGIEELKATGMLDRRGGLTSIAMGTGELDDESDEGEEAEAQFDLMPMDGDAEDEEG